MTSSVYRNNAFGREIIKRECARFGISINQLLRGRRDQRVVVLRRSIARVLREAGWSSVQIGRLINRDHSTVLYLLKQREREAA